MMDHTYSLAASFKHRRQAQSNRMMGNYRLIAKHEPRIPADYLFISSISSVVVSSAIVQWLVLHSL